MASTSFGSKKRPAGKQWRSSSSKEIFDNLYKNVDAAFGALEAAVSAGYAPVRSASTGNAANLASFTVTNDGVTLVAGDRVLLKDQGTATQNGIYVVGTVANGSAPLTRATDMEVGAAFTDGDAVWCQEGTTNGNKEFRLTTSGVVDTNNIAYVTLTTSINAGSITATELATSSVTAAKIAAGAVTPSKIGYLTAATVADAATTVTGAQLFGGIVKHTPTTVDRTPNTDTAANILSAFTGQAVGASFRFVYANLSDPANGFKVTLGAGAGVTLYGNPEVAKGETASFLVHVTGAATVDIYRL
jgi:hypothetical protein